MTTAAQSAWTSARPATRSTGPTWFWQDCENESGSVKDYPEPTWPDAAGPQVIALARRDPQSRTVSLIMDAATANITMYAVSAYAGDREAHVREVEQSGEKLPEDSYGRRNRQAIATREARVAARLRAIERASAWRRPRALRIAAVSKPQP